MVVLKDSLAVEHLNLYAYGTYEGAKKGWDARGRGRKAAKPKEGRLKRIEKRLEGDEGGDVVVGLTALRQQHARLSQAYQAIGKQIDGLERKLTHADEVRSVAGRFLHFVKGVGEWLESFHALSEGIRLAREVTATAALAVWAGMHEYHLHAAKLYAVLDWAHSHMSHIFQTASILH